MILIGGLLVFDKREPESLTLQEFHCVRSVISIQNWLNLHVGYFRIVLLGLAVFSDVRRDHWVEVGYHGSYVI